MRTLKISQIRNLFTAFSLLLVVSSTVLAHGLDCGLSPLDFEESISVHWTLADLNSSGVAWSSNASCGEAANYAGSGEAGCISSITTSASSVDAVLQSADFFIGCNDSVKLNFDLNLQLSSSQASLNIEASTDNGVSWETVESFEQNAGSFRSGTGVAKSVELSSFSSDGFSPILVRFRYKDASITASDWYVQLDNAEVVCLASERADIEARVDGNGGIVNEGVVESYTFRARNIGPAEAKNVKLLTSITGPYELLSASSSDGTVQMTDKGLEISLGNFAASDTGDMEIEITLQRPARFYNPGELSTEVKVIGTVASDTCDIRLNNNQHFRAIDFLHDTDEDGIIDAEDFCPENWEVSSEGEDCGVNTSSAREELTSLLFKTSKKLKHLTLQSNSTRQKKLRRSLKRLRAKIKNLRSDHQQALSILSSSFDVNKNIGKLLKRIKGVLKASGSSFKPRKRKAKRLLAAISGEI